VRQDIREASEALVSSIVGMIEGEPVESTLMAPRLIVRESCGSSR
jgi:DNA-binding LacI/PurR family transcriptional regulator